MNTTSIIGFIADKAMIITKNSNYIELKNAVKQPNGVYNWDWTYPMIADAVDAISGKPLKTYTDWSERRTYKSYKWADILSLLDRIYEVSHYEIHAHKNNLNGYALGKEISKKDFSWDSIVVCETKEFGNPKPLFDGELFDDMMDTNSDYHN